jgi:hypothetical protein
MSSHEARYGLRVCAVKVSENDHEKGTIYVHADRLSVSGGALMFAAEAQPFG